MFLSLCFERKYQGTVSKSFRLQSKRKEEKREKERENQKRCTIESFVEILLYASKGNMKEWSPNRSDFNRKGKEERKGEERERIRNIARLQSEIFVYVSRGKNEGIVQISAERKKKKRCTIVESFVEILLYALAEKENEGTVLESFRFQSKRKRREERREKRELKIAHS